MPIRGALAVCDPTPTRSLAHLYIVTPWPDGESMVETIAHELTHACLSPLSALLGNNPAAIMMEEQAVEQIGKALAMVGVGEARAMARAIGRYAPERLRARLKISTLATRARVGEKNMDPNVIKEALDAIESGDAAKCAEILKALIASAASGGAEPDGDEAPMGAQMAAPGDGGASKDAPPPMDARMVARLRADANEIAKIKGELADIAKDARSGAMTLLVDGLRARLPGHAGLPAIEKRILAAPDYATAKAIRDIAIEMAPAVTGSQRARSGVGGDAAPANASGETSVAPETLASLIGEGIPPALANDYLLTYKADKGAAVALLNGARARLGKPVNPWTGANGVSKGS